MATKGTLLIPAFGKIEELSELDDFIWATLHGWGALPAAKELRSLVPLIDQEGDPKGSAKRLADNLRSEEQYLRLNKFTAGQAESEYPYLFELASVRLWAWIEAAVRELLVEAVRQPTPLPDASALAKLKAPILPFFGAGLDQQAELLADALWQSVQGAFVGIERFEKVFEKLGLLGAPHNTVGEILTELSEVRHCVVHRNGQADRRLLTACPWLGDRIGARLPANLQRYWYYRTAAYSYLMSLLRRWARWRQVPKILELSNAMDATVLEELIPGWMREKRTGASGETEAKPPAAGA